jgi:hypothetical protein
MRNLQHAVVTASVLSAAVGAAEADNLVKNGDFNENTDGWTLIEHDCANWYCLGGCNTNLLGGWDGSCGWFYVNSGGGVVETSQVITGLVPGETYLVSGYFARDTALHPDGSFNVLIDDDLYIEASGNQGEWTEFAFEYVAGGTEVLLRLQSQVKGDDAYGIDHISIVLKPPCYADCNKDGALDLFDFLCFFNEFATGCP